MKLPIQKVVMPSTLAGITNGKLPDRITKEVGPSGKLEITAARAWLALVAAAKDAGYDLTYTYGGTFRSYMSQVDLFKRRYTLKFGVGNVTSQSRTWNGQRWWKLRSVAAAATPGTSNHGWGLAIDTALGAHPKDATPITPALGWLVENAPEYGFSWELKSEPWHIRYVTGDKIPQAVLDFEAGTPRVEKPVVQEEDYRRQTCRRGMRGNNAVREMQERLTKAGFRTSADGWFGRKTEQSLRKFQASNGLTVDAICGPKTWRKLIEATNG